MAYRFDPEIEFKIFADRLKEAASEFVKGFSVEVGGFSPRIDLDEDDEKLYLTAEMPGINKENVKLSMRESALVIEGDKKRPEYDGKRNLRTERKYGKFSRSIPFSENVDEQKITAKFDNGILTVVIDKKEPEKPKEKEINID